MFSIQVYATLLRLIEHTCIHSWRNYVDVVPWEPVDPGSIPLWKGEPGLQKGSLHIPRPPLMPACCPLLFTKGHLSQSSPRERCFPVKGTAHRMARWGSPSLFPPIPSTFLIQPQYNQTGYINYTSINLEKMRNCFSLWNENEHCVGQAVEESGNQSIL